ncbi:MAG: hypothetical protein U9Q15_00680 [Patescibacteria group bacterium]|nr:hypothetical protein [Patescibacteria group bacterium]
MINKVLQELGKPKLENIYYLYLDNRYVLEGELDIRKLVKLDQVDCEQRVLLSGEEEEKEISVPLWLMIEDEIEETIENIQRQLVLDEEEINQIHPFSGSKYTEYFGKDRAFGTIYGKGLTAPKAVKELYNR